MKNWPVFDGFDCVQHFLDSGSKMHEKCVFGHMDQNLYITQSSRKSCIIDEQNRSVECVLGFLELELYLSQCILDS